MNGVQIRFYCMLFLFIPMLTLESGMVKTASIFYFMGKLIMDNMDGKEKSCVQ